MLNKLKDLKNKSGLTLEQIADKSGIPISTVRRIFSGSTSNPQMSTVFSIVRVMGGKVDDLFDTEEIRIDLDPETPQILDVPKASMVAVDGEAWASRHAEIVELYEKQIATRDKFIKALCIGFALIILVMALVDIFLPNIGFIRY